MIHFTDTRSQVLGPKGEWAGLACRACRAFLKPFQKNQPSQEDISDHSHPNSYLRGLSGYHSGQRGWKSVNTTRMDSVSLRKGVTKDMKTKSVEAEMNALTLTVPRGTQGNVDTFSSVDTVSSVKPVPTATWFTRTTRLKPWRMKLLD